MRPINEIIIRFIPHDQQRYNTAGDWTFDGDTLRINVSRTPDPRHAQLVAFHELAEVLACNVDGVSQEAVDGFDITGPGKDLDDPGLDPRAPYHEQHMTATAVEIVLARALNVGWAEYEEALACLGED